MCAYICVYMCVYIYICVLCTILVCMLYINHTCICDVVTVCNVYMCGDSVDSDCYTLAHTPHLHTYVTHMHIWRESIWEYMVGICHIGPISPNIAHFSEFFLGDSI